MNKKVSDILDEQELDKEIAELDKRLADLAALQARRNDLVVLKQLATKLWGTRPTNGTLPLSVPVPLPGMRRRRGQTTASFIHKVLTEKGPLTTQDLLAEMRRRGYNGSGEDAVDKKRLLAAMYGVDEMFERSDDGRWKVH